MNKDILFLLRCFSHSYINNNCEFIAHRNIGNACFSVLDVKESEIKEKVLEWFSRDAYKSEYFQDIGMGKKRNDEYHNYMVRSINRYLGTDFKESDFELIYIHLGNCINHNLTKRFIKSNYDISVLEEGRNK